MAKKLNQAERRKAREMAALRVEKDFLRAELERDFDSPNIAGIQNTASFRRQMV